MKLQKEYTYKKYCSGMTYVELIVVLSIFSIMTSIMMFNYRSFQSRVDIKNLASDLALKVVQAQKYSVSGKLPPGDRMGLVILDWRPSFGVYIDTAFNTRFIFFTDMNQDGSCNASCGTFVADNEFIEGVNINNGNRISGIDVYNNSGSICSSPTILNIVFKRPNSDALFNMDQLGSCGTIDNVDHVVIHITSNDSTPATSNVKVYKSGRIQIK